MEKSQIIYNILKFVIGLSLALCIWSIIRKFDISVSLQVLGFLVLLPFGIVLSYLLAQRIFLSWLKNYSFKIRSGWIASCLLTGFFLVYLFALPLDFHNNEIRITATGQKSPNAKGLEVWLASISSGHRLFPYNLMKICQGSWNLRKDYLFSNQLQPNKLNCTLRTNNDEINITFRTHPSSGKVRLIYEGQTIQDDLYSEVAGSKIVSLQVSRGRIRKLAMYALFLADGIAIGALLLAMSAWFVSSPSVQSAYSKCQSLRSMWPAYIQRWFGTIPESALRVISGLIAIVLICIIVFWIAAIYSRLGLADLNLWRRIPIDSSTIYEVEGFSYKTVTDPLCSSHTGKSPCILLENGEPLLAPANSNTYNIAHYGEGRSLFWHGFVYFSTPDNTDPTTNGRHYEVRIPPLLLSNVEITYLFFLSFLSIVGLWRIIRFQKISISIPPLVKVFNQIPTVLFILLPIFVYAALFILPVPVRLLKNTEALYLINAAAILFWTLGKPGKKWFLISFTVILACIGLSLASLWYHTRFHYSAIGGLIPWSDGSGYYSDAIHISAGEKVNYSIWANRILHTTFLSGLLALTNMNLQATLALMGFLWGIVILFLSKELEYSIGYGSGAICAFLCLAFYHVYASGTLLSENTGFLLGGMGAVLLINGARRKDFIQVLMGIFLTTLALNARSGAYFVIPLLILWASIYFAKGFSIKNFIIATAASVTAFGVNKFYQSYFNDLTRNLDYSSVRIPELIWGAVTRNSPRAVSSLYPDLTRAEVSQKLIPIILQLIKSDPLNVVNNIFYRYYENILQPNARLLIGFIGKISYIGLSLLTVFYVLLFVGIAICLFRFKQKAYGLLLFSFLGISISVPLVYYVGYRALASTMPLTFCTIAVGAAFLIEKLTKKPAGINTSALQKSKFDYILLMTAVGVIGWMMIMPVLTATIKPNKADVIDSCDHGISLTTTEIEGSFIRIIADSAGSASRVPYIDKSSFIWSNPAPDAWMPGFKQALESVDVDSTIFFNTYLSAFIIIPKNLSFDENSDLSLCLSRVNSLSQLLNATSVNSVSDVNWTRRLVFWGVLVVFSMIVIFMGTYIFKRKDHINKGGVCVDLLEYKPQSQPRQIEELERDQNSMSEHLDENELVKEYEKLLEASNQYGDTRYRDELVSQSSYWLNGFWQTYKTDVVDYIPPDALNNKVVVDFGCKFGHSIPLFFAKGVKKVIGVEALDRYIQVGQDIFESYGDRVKYEKCEDGFVPLQPESVGLVVVNEVISHVNPTLLPRIYSEIARILTIGGTVFVSDYNNLLNRAYISELIEGYDALENGPDGRIWQGNPIYSFLTMRKNTIQNRCPGLEAEKIEFLAKNTSGLFGDHLIKVIDQYCQTGELILRPYRRGIAPAYPDSGQVEERAFYPEQVEFDLMEQGFDCTIVHGESKSVMIGKRYALENKRMKLETGYPGAHAFSAPIPQDILDEQGKILVLLENDIPLPHSESAHAEIAEKGMGRYSVWFWNRTIYFSSSDNSNPRKNKRKYELFVIDRKKDIYEMESSSTIRVIGIKRH